MLVCKRKETMQTMVEQCIFQLQNVEANNNLHDKIKACDISQQKGILCGITNQVNVVLSTFCKPANS